MDRASDSEGRCAIILAGGEGKRLQPLVQKWLRDPLPKQYVSLIGSRSLLEHSFERAEMLVRRERIFTVVSRDHLRYPAVQKQVAGRARETVLLQPRNRDTAPGVLLPLMALHKKYPDSTVAIFPSDHFILEERLFMRHVEMAFSMVEQNPSQLVVLGVQPTHAETEFGYILPDGRHSASSLKFLCRVKRFVEKPERQTAEELIHQGGLWNTMVVVANAQSLLRLIQKLLPDLYCNFQRIYRALGTSSEARLLEEVYNELGPANFSKEILEILPLKFPSSLSTLPVQGVFWSDMGLPRYVEAARRMMADRLRTTNPEVPAQAPSSMGNSLWRTV